MNARTRRLLGALLPTLLLMVGALPFFRPSRPAPQPSERTPAEIEKILDEIVATHRLKAGRMSCGGRSDDVWMLYLKGRMLALVYPDVMEGLLISRAADPTLDPRHRGYCITLLGELAKAGRQAAAATLLSLSENPDQPIRSLAMRELSKVDLQGEHRRLYLSRCREGMWEAFDAVALWNDPATVQELERIVAASSGDQHPEGDLRLSAQHALKRLGILDSPDWNVQIERILAAPGGGDYDLDWALQVARSRRFPGALEALRRGLDRIENPLPPDASSEERRDFDAMERDGGRITARVAQGRSLGFGDDGFDDALIAYVEMGGTPNEFERDRLYLFGYWGDIRKRLEELLPLPTPRD